MELTWEAILLVAGAISAIGGSWLTVRKIQKDADASREKSEGAILAKSQAQVDKAMAERKLIQKEFEGRLSEIEQDLAAHKAAVEKDFAHVRETYNGEIRNLGQKIEDLRSELRNQHTQMVTLLTKMIDNSKD